MTDDTAYKLVIGAAVQTKADAAKNLGTDKEYSFTTGSMGYALTGTGNSNYTATPAVLLSKTETVNTGIDLTKNFDVKFNKNVDPNSVGTNTCKLYNVTDSKYVAALPTVTADTVTLNPEVDLVAGKLYRVEIKGVRDLLGTEMFHESFLVTANATGITATALKADGSTFSGATDRIWPKAQAGQLDGKSSILSGGKLYLTFNQTQKLDESTVNASNITLKQYNTATEKFDIAVPVTVSYDSTTRRATITPEADLADGKRFELAWSDSIKDEYGMKITKGTQQFYTYDVTAPTVTGVEMKTGATGTFAAVQTGVTGVDETKTIYVKFNFSEAVGHKALANAAGAATTTAPGVEGVGDGTVKTLGTGNSIMVVNAATGNIVNAPAAAFANSNKELVLTFTGLANNTTYTVLLSGKDGAPTSSAPDRNVFVDLTDDITITAAAADNNNRLLDTYSFTFSTKGQDTTAPTVAGVKYGAAYATGKDLAGATNLKSSSEDIFVQFSEKIALTGNPITLTHTNDTTTYAQAFADYSPAITTTADTTEAGNTLTVSGIVGVVAGDIVEVKNGADTAYAIVKSATGTTITLVSPVGKIVATGATVKKLAGVTVSDAATDAKTLQIDLATANAGLDVTADKSHKLTLTDKITDVAGNKLTAVNYTFITGSANGDDETVKTIKASAKASNDDAYNVTLPGNDVKKTTKIQIEFNEDYDPLTINATTVKVTDSKNNVVSMALDNTTDTKKVFGQFASELTAGETYTITVEGVKDKAGNTITKAVKTFIVADTGAPTATVSIADNAVNVPVNQTIEIQFSKAMDISTIKNAANHIQLKDSSDTNVPAAVSYDTATNKATVTPVSLLNTGSAYTLLISENDTNVTDAAGNKMKKVQMSFTTSTNQVYAQITKAQYSLSSDGKTGTLYLTLSNPLKATDAKTTAFNDATTVANFNAIFSLVDGAVPADTVNTTNYTANSKLLTITFTDEGGAVISTSIVKGTTKISVNAGELVDERGVTLSTSPVTIE